MPRANPLLACAALLACAVPARYVVVSDSPAEWRGPVDASQRLICLAPADVGAVAPMLELRTLPDVERYGRERRGDRGPVEDVLYAVVAGDYDHAEAALRSRPSAIPEYLRRLLAADLASERRATVPAGEVLKLYQDAYDAQESKVGKTIIELRIRQLRYGR